MSFTFRYHQGAVCAAKTEGITKDSADVGFCRPSSNIKFFGVLVRVLEVQVWRYKVILHHDERIDNFTGSRHPAFMASHSLSATDEGVLSVE